MKNDEDIVRDVLDGDAEAFAELVERYGPAVVRMVRNITCDGCNCEDIAQDVFLAAYRKLRSYDSSRSRFSTWLFTIARNRSINAIRRRKATPLVQISEPVDETGPGQALENAELMELLDRRLAQLPARLRRAFVLAEFEGLGYDEIARIENIRKGTVKSRVSRARARLRKGLAPYAGDVV